VADFMELGELMARDALHRNESCGGHFREEYQTPEGEALRDDENFCYVGAWKYTGRIRSRCCTRSRWSFENVHLAQR
jgi:succinate dehydrogenase / fumarate reductase flavoprotein subunit